MIIINIQSSFTFLGGGSFIREFQNYSYNYKVFDSM